jgi:hypothetical protein
LHAISQAIPSVQVWWIPLGNIPIGMPIGCEIEFVTKAPPTKPPVWLFGGALSAATALVDIARFGAGTSLAKTFASEPSEISHFLSLWYDLSRQVVHSE